MARLSKSTSTLSLGSVLKRRKEFNLNMDVQRQAGVWPDDKKSLCIHSVMYGYSLGLFSAVEKNNILYNIVDGLQRITTTNDYQLDKFALKLNTPDLELEYDVDTKIESLPEYTQKDSYYKDVLNEETKLMENKIFYKIAGKKFSELPEELQKEIRDYNITIYVYKNMTYAEIDEFFYRTNNNLPLTKMEKTRSKAGNIRGFLDNVAKTPFFVEKINVSDSVRKHRAEEQIVLESMMLFEQELDSSFQGKAIEDYTIKLNATGISKETQDFILKTCEYLNEAIAEKMKILNKKHIPMVMYCAYNAFQDGVAPSIFGLWLTDFFEKKIPEYELAALNGPSKPASITKRFQIMNDDYANCIDDYELVDDVDESGEATENTGTEELDANNATQESETNNFNENIDE